MIYIVYHGGDTDGFCSGAIVRDFCNKKGWESELYPMNYGDEFSLMDKLTKEDTVYMVDFSLQPYEQMIKLGKKCELIWIDHHKTSVEALASPGFDAIVNHANHIVVDTSCAACELTWRYLYPNLEVPRMIRLLSLYDTWNHNDKEPWERIEAFQTGLGVNETNPSKNWDLWQTMFDFYKKTEGKIDREILESDIINDICKDGDVINAYLTRRNETLMASHGFIAEWEGYKCFIINGDGYLANYLTSSPQFGDCEVGVVYSNVEGKYWVISLRSRTVDVSEIAKRYGGGGHRNSAGLQCANLWAKNGMFKVIKRLV